MLFDFYEGRLAGNVSYFQAFQCLILAGKCSYFLKEEISLLTSMLLSPRCDSTLRFILKFNRNNLRDFFYYDDQIFLTIQ